MKKDERLLPMNLQFFATSPNPAPEDPAPTEPAPPTNPAPADPAPPADTPPADTAPKDDKSQESPEELIARLLAENNKLKRASDKNASEAAEYKKRYHEKLSETEKVDLEKAEAEAKRQEEFEALKKESALNKLEKQYLKLGYDEVLAGQIATAQYDGNDDEVFRLQQQFLTQRDRAKEAEWMKKLPNPPMDNKDGNEDPFLKGFNSK